MELKFIPGKTGAQPGEDLNEVQSLDHCSVYQCCLLSFVSSTMVMTDSGFRGNGVPSSQISLVLLFQPFGIHFIHIEMKNWFKTLARSLKYELSDGSSVFKCKHKAVSWVKSALGGEAQACCSRLPTLAKIHPSSLSLPWPRWSRNDTVALSTVPRQTCLLRLWFYSPEPFSFCYYGCF